jgi:hypothetical protein
MRKFPLYLLIILLMVKFQRSLEIDMSQAPCLFLHHLPTVSLHFMAILCIFQN